MREFFSIDGPFSKAGNFAADTLIVSMMWIVFSIPVITIGASTSAAYYVCTRRLSNREGYITSDFWHAFKMNFFKATKIWLIVFVCIALLMFNFLHMDAFGNMQNIVWPLQIFAFAQIFFVSIYLFAITARFDMGFLQTIKTSFFMANRHLLTSIICTIVFILLILGSFYTFHMILIFAPGIYAMFSSHMIMKIFRKYRPEMDKDPVIEIQEIEAQRAEDRRKSEISTFETDSEAASEDLAKNDEADSDQSKG